MFAHHEPADLVSRSKFNWMVATSLTALTGFMVIAGALWLMGDASAPQLTTREISPGTAIKRAAAPAQPNNTAARTALTSVTASKSDKIANLDIRPLSAAPQDIPAPVIAKTPAPATTVIAKTSEPVDTAAMTAPRDTGAAPELKANVETPEVTPRPEVKTADAGTADEAVKTADAADEAESDNILISIEKGDTIFGVLTQSGINKQEAYEIARSLTRVFPVSSLRAGHTLSMTMAAPGENGALRPEMVILSAGKDRQFKVELEDDGGYKVAKYDGEPITRSAARAPAGNKTPVNNKALTRKIASIIPEASDNDKSSAGVDSIYQRTRSRIQSSFYTSAIKQNIPRRIVNKMSTVLSYGVDFQREISRGDVYEVFYSNAAGKDEGVLYSELNARGRKHAYYRFRAADGEVGYYDANGRSARKSLMRTPVSGARITSGFGRRHHPILKYNKMHSGIDFGAPRGTPIYAAADGKVVKAGWAGGYGKYVRIRHTSKMETAYAHMSRISRGLRPGKKVSQGQIIGYVGSTGRSTGPHLHYEIRVSGRAVNPLRYKGNNIGKTRKLSGRQFAAFKREVRRIDALRHKTAITTFVAEAGN